MRAYIVFSGTGPILILTTYSELENPGLVAKLRHKGIIKFIAYEVPVDSLHRRYGVPFEVVASDLERGQAMRVLDFNGPHILDTFRLSELGSPIPYEH